jgi:hypothetical protein
MFNKLHILLYIYIYIYFYTLYFYTTFIGSLYVLKVGKSIILFYFIFNSKKTMFILNKFIYKSFYKQNK